MNPSIEKQSISPSLRSADRRTERRVAEVVRQAAGRLPAGAGSLGLDPEECQALLKVVGEGGSLIESTCTEPGPAPLLLPLIALIWGHRASDEAWTRLMTGAIGCACFGEHHLWQDLGLSARSEVSALLVEHFPQLAAGNTRGLRWKRYLFLCLGEELGIDDLAPPRCDGCNDSRVCFPAGDNRPFSIAVKSTR